MTHAGRFPRANLAFWEVVSGLLLIYRQIPATRREFLLCQLLSLFPLVQGIGIPHSLGLLLNHFFCLSIQQTLFLLPSMCLILEEEYQIRSVLVLRKNTTAVWASPTNKLTIII